MQVKERLRLLRGPLLLPLVPAAMGGYAVAVGNLTDGSACPIYRLTGMPCPGCGGTRAVLELFQGNLSTAFAYNAFFLVFALGVGGGWAWWTLARARGREVGFPLPPLPYVWVLLGAVIGWVVFRLTPLYPGIAL